MNIYLVKKQDYNKLANTLNDIVFRNNHNKEHMKVKFFALRYENMMKNAFKNEFDKIFKLYTGNDSN